MKTLWQKTPAWLKAIFFNFIMLYPVIILIQWIIGTNFQIGMPWAWALPVTVMLLYIFWRTVNKFADFHKDSDVRLAFGFQIQEGSNWSYLLSIILLTPSIITLWAYLFKIESTAQFELIASFRSLAPQTALPLLLALALSAGIVEEVVYRGFIQNTLRRTYSKWVSFFLVAIIFALMHFLPLPLVIPYMAVSLLFSYVADKTRSTGVVIMAHILADFIIFVLIHSDPAGVLQPTALNVVVLSASFIAGLGFLLLPLKQKSVSSAGIRFMNE